MNSIRNIVALTAAAGGLGALIVFASLPATAAVGGHQQKLQSNTFAAQPQTVAEATVPDATTPTQACTNAKTALDAWKAKDKTEDTAEKTSATAANNEKTEDPTENADAKKLRDAVFTSCASPACQADVKALKDAAAKDKTGEDATEKTSSTEKSTADQAEDTLERDAAKALLTKVRSDCAGISTK